MEVTRRLRPESNEMKFKDAPIKNLQAAAHEGVLKPSEVNELYEFLWNRSGGEKRGAQFNVLHTFYYLGGMFAISSMTVFATLSIGAWSIQSWLLLALVYMFAAISAATLLQKRESHIPAGIFATLAVACVPLVVFLLQTLLGVWTSGYGRHYRDLYRFIDGRWIVMELSTLGAGAVLLWQFRYPFLLMPLSLTAWFMSMDIIPAFFGTGDIWSPYDVHLRALVSVAFGLAMLIVAFAFDKRRSSRGNDYSFWIYLFGLKSFNIGLIMLHTDNLSGKLIFLAINICMVFLGAILSRRVFAVFGGIGITVVLGDLAYSVFSYSLEFVLALSFMGFGLIGIGLWWNTYEAVVSKRFQDTLSAMRKIF